MKRWTVCLFALVLASCSAPAPRFDPWRTQNTCADNPAFLPITDAFFVWETVVDVLDDYFVIQQERPVQVLDQVITEGRVDTFPRLGATLLEPWLRDSVNFDERLESTLQPIRRHAHARVIPANGGFLVEVIVYKELEAVGQPDHATAGRAVFLESVTQDRIAQPTPEFPPSQGWILLGRDYLLEQRILGQLLDRVGQSR